MIIKKELAYKEMYFPTPRHRKMRSREVTGEFTVEIPEITAAGAPVVLRVHDRHGWADDICADDYRQYGDQLYTQARRGFFFRCEASDEGNAITAEELADSNIIRVPDCRYMEHDAVMREFCSEASVWLIIDGVAWKKSPEPFYKVMTFGFGNNHGGTALMIIANRTDRRDEDTFSALQEQEARKAALDTAAGRGDTNYFSMIKNSACRIEVLDASAIRFQRDKVIFEVEKTITHKVFVNACSYAEALKLAKQIPNCHYTEGHVSYTYPAEVVTEEEWKATGRSCYDEAAVAVIVESEVSET